MTAAPIDAAPAQGSATTAQDSATTAPSLPVACGPLSEAVVAALSSGAVQDLPPVPADTDPLGRDLQLALYTLYELHYRGFDGVDAELEWEPDVLRLRRDLERG